ncbi:MAG: hypothetical protein HY22_11655 [[Candidatus Thermochlorobacteriaceae] bacterium GBChlB]|nr:MAG: hypothetical protein HY22_11655 [[Candidatus Thermochlorobacteriaceae] bacterium GBChlB]
MTGRQNFIDLYAELGLTPRATAEEIRRAYMEQIKDVHPDKFQNASPRERERAERKTQLLNEAKDILLDDDKRRDYDFLYKQRLAEAVDVAAKVGFDGQRYDAYMSNAERFRQMAERDSSSRAKPFIFIMVALMTGVTLLWRFVNPEDIGKPAPPKEVPTITEPQVVYQASGAVLGITLSKNGTLLAAVDKIGVDVWRIDAPDKKTTLNETNAFSIASVGESVAVGTKDGKAKLFRLESDGGATLIRTLDAHQSAISSVSFSADGKWLLTASWDKTAKIWNAESGDLLRTRMGIAFPIYAAAFDKDARSVGFTNDQQSMLWTWRDGTLKNLTLHRKRILAMSVSSTDWVLSAGEDRILKQVHIPTTTTRATDAEPSVCLAVAYSADGQLFASAGADGVVRVYASNSCRKLDVMQAHQGKATSVVFSPDGRRLYSAGADGAIKAWDMSKYAPLQTP